MTCFDCDEGPCYMNCGPVIRFVDGKPIMGSGTVTFTPEEPMRRIGKYRLTKSAEDGLWRIRGPHGTKPIIIARTPARAIDKLRKRIASHRSAH